MDERRQDARRRVCLGGLIEAAAFLPEIPCTLRNVSLTGAQVRVAPGAILPERIVLSVPSRGEQRLAELVWREGELAGFRFQEAREKPADRPPSAARPRGDETLH
ncbi:PilZ domain-containing protein [Methylobacterium aerolatum]|uniref:PilZ domain-containing protein n=1 Tax=Methylobacterium aerolatum TaxID=418708 RepID=A0ABU0HZ70_9HYPH|nr:PilZ domain-containing protein [Methylobacterium aerolatum]MDQ0446774.1 hypothetical protein [Methylobacterium aerolatum]GJD33740.1 hypothetical protein FMGBMHLM_0633 [Methylobacterium aerolatum]